jgi:hypothetical protein
LKIRAIAPSCIASCNLAAPMRIRSPATPEGEWLAGEDTGHDTPRDFQQRPREKTGLDVRRATNRCISCDHAAALPGSRNASTSVGKPELPKGDRRRATTSQWHWFA